MKSRFESFVITVWKMNKIVRNIKIAEMERYGLKAVHVMVLHYLKNNPLGLTAAELTKLTLEDKAAMSRALASLEEKGYLSVEKANGKKYNAVVFLTEEGKKVAEEMSEKADKAVENCSLSLTEEERESFYRSLAAIAENLSVYYASLKK